MISSNNFNNDNDKSVKDNHENNNNIKDNGYYCNHNDNENNVYMNDYYDCNIIYIININEIYNSQSMLPIITLN